MAFAAELAELAETELAESLYTGADAAVDRLFPAYLSGIGGSAIASSIVGDNSSNSSRGASNNKYYSVRRKFLPTKKVVTMSPYRRRINTGPKVLVVSKRPSIRKSYRKSKRIGKYGARHIQKRHANIIERPIRGQMRMLQVTRTAFGSQASGGTNPSNLRYNRFTGTSGAFGFEFSLDQIGSYTDFTALFQYYKIVQCELHLIPKQNSYPALTAAATQTTRTNGNDSIASSGYDPVCEIPYVIMAADNGSSSGFTTIGDALAHEGSCVHYFTNGKPYVMRISPTVLRLAGTAGSEATTYVPKRMWINTSDSSEKHYGVRGYVEGLYSSVSIDVLIKYKVVFKDLKT